MPEQHTSGLEVADIPPGSTSGSRVDADLISFSEAGRAWREIPPWARFCLDLGFRERTGSSSARSILIVSLPCDSVAAGLIALGGVIADLGRDAAIDLSRHQDSLLRFARQYLQACSRCDTRCNPEEANCGYAAESSGQLRNERTGRHHQIHGVSADNNIVIAMRGGGTSEPRRSALRDWQIRHEPPLDMVAPESALAPDLYARLMPDASILMDNLRKSSLDLCLAGRSAGEAQTRAACDQVRFRSARCDQSLLGLLPVKGWSQHAVVRLNYFNPRTGTLKNQTKEISLAIADGTTSFLKVLGRKEFERSDVIGIVSRLGGQDERDALGEKISSLRRWYDDVGDLGGLPAPPPGISIRAMRRRK